MREMGMAAKGITIYPILAETFEAGERRILK
jgi:hypothetical protein